MHDADILASIAAGDTEQFGVLYDAYFPRIYNYLFYRTRSRETAEDLVSATFLKAVRHLGTFDARRGTFSSWLYRIARNTLYDHFRRTPPVRPIEEDEEFVGPGDLERETVDRDLVRKVNECVLRLPQRQQEIIALRIWDDLPYAEIAAILGRSEGSCKMEFSRAMKKLRDMAPFAAAFLLFTAIRYF